MILAGTSAHGHCPACGKGWVRVVEASGATNESNLKIESDGVPGLQPGTSGDRVRKLDGKNYTHIRIATDRWEPSCDHNLPPVPGVVLDPFLGSGTTARVAQSLGRNWLGIELNPAYGKLQDGRITQQGFAFS